MPSNKTRQDKTAWGIICDFSHRERERVALSSSFLCSFSEQDLFWEDDLILRFSLFTKEEPQGLTSQFLITALYFFGSSWCWGVDYGLSLWLWLSLFGCKGGRDVTLLSGRIWWMVCWSRHKLRRAPAQFRTYRSRFSWKQTRPTSLS